MKSQKTKLYLFLIFTILLLITPSIYAKTILLAMSANTNGLQFANKDNTDFSYYLKKTYHYPKNKQFILYQIKNVTYKKYKNAIRSIKQRISSADHLIVYFSGHGTTIYDMNNDEQDGFDEALVTYRSNSSNTRITDKQLIIDDELSADLRWLNPRRLSLILDTCLSGGMQKALTQNIISRPINKFIYSNYPSTRVPKKIFSPLEGAKGLLDNTRGELFAASSNGEEAFEYNNKKIKGGIFTHSLVNALKHSSSIDQAFQEAQQQVRKITGGQQVPRKYIYP